MRPELLAPAGGPEALTAAVQCGADAVYLGCGDFNARRSAKNFTPEELASAVEYCHLRGVRVYLTLNTLLTDRELPAAASLAAYASEVGVDALLVQDWGVLRAVRAAAPDLPLHASTQMSIHNLDGAKVARDLGLTRVVLAREMDREEIAAVCALEGLETEVFVHGAHCMSYSGQCAMSALIGGRSGNRGRCAQPCRLPCAAGGGTKYALSLKDLSLAEHVPELMALGVTSLKLEGRMKRPEYVAVVTGVYARLLQEGRGPTRAEREALTAAFSRSGFTDGYFTGQTGPVMFGVRDNDAGEPRDLFAAARAFYETGEHRRVAVSFSLTVRRDAPAQLNVRDGAGRCAAVSGPVPENARTRALTAEDAAARLAKTGGTVYEAAAVEASVDEGLSLSAAALNGLRRSALDALTAKRTALPRRTTRPYLPAQADRAGRPAAPRYTVSVAEAGQVTAELLGQVPARLYVPLEEIEKLPCSAREQTEVCAVLPRVWKERRRDALRRMLEALPKQGVALAAVSNLGHLALAEGCGLTLCGDLGLNLFNSEALCFWRDKGLCSAAASFELRCQQLRDLQNFLPLETVVYGRLPLMLTENFPGGTAGAKTLTDRTGAAFPLLPLFDGCWEIENAKTLFLLDKAEELNALGLDFLRLRFTTESPASCAALLRAAREGTAAVPAEGTYTRGLFYRGVE